MTQQEKKRPPNPSSIPMDDPRYPIWGRVWYCKVPRIARYGTAYLERYGLPTSGNQNVDRELMKQLAPVYITIAQMVEYYHEHTMVSIIKRDDTKAIYEICQDYTFDWARRIQNTVFNHNVPFEDLVQIDEFAEAVYQYAGHEYGEEFARTFIPEGVQREIVDLHKMFEAVDNRVKNRGKIKSDQYTVRNRYSPNPVVDAKPVTQQEEKKLPERPTMRDIFLSYMDRNGIHGRVQ
uniref:Uncharacterized protein n=1 Tax=Burkholderia phage vB_BgluM-SURPRISE13 TaxID=3159457 RepID=A0AAU7PF85_9VIRU